MKNDITLVNDNSQKNKSSSRNGKKTTREFSVPSVEYTLKLDTEDAIHIYFQRYKDASRSAYSFFKNCGRLETKPLQNTVRIMRSSLEHQFDKCLSEIGHIHETLKQTVEQIKKNPSKNFLPLSYSSPINHTIKIRTHYAHQLANALITLDEIVKFLDFCQYYAIVPTNEITATKNNAIKIVRRMHITVIRHDNGLIEKSRTNSVNVESHIEIDAEV
jgi:hypothetical protein